MMSLRPPITMTRVPSSQTCESSSSPARMSSPRMSLSRMMMLGVGEPRYASTAAATPPICTRRWAFARRRSSAAACIEAAVSVRAQKAWIETRGAGAMKSTWSTGAAPASIASAVCRETFMSLADVADLALIGARIAGARAFAFAILLEHYAAPPLVGGNLAARLDQVGRVVDHGGEVALAGAAEIPMLPVLLEDFAVGRTEVMRPQSAWSCLGGDARIVEPDGGEPGPLGRPIWPHRDPLVRQASGDQDGLDLVQRFGRSAFVRSSRRHIDDDATGRVALPSASESEDVGALRRRQAAVARSDEHLDCLTPLLQRDRMAMTVIGRDHLHRLVLGVATGQSGGERGERRKAGGLAAVGDNRADQGCHRISLLGAQSMMNPKRLLYGRSGLALPCTP